MDLGRQSIVFLLVLLAIASSSVRAACVVPSQSELDYCTHITHAVEADLGPTSALDASAKEAVSGGLRSILGRDAFQAFDPTGGVDWKCCRAALKDTQCALYFPKCETGSSLGDPPEDLPCNDMCERVISACGLNAEEGALVYDRLKCGTEKGVYSDDAGCVTHETGCLTVSSPIVGSPAAVLAANQALVVLAPLLLLGLCSVFTL